MGKPTIGDTVSDWTILDYAPNKNGRTYFLCRCSCGSVREVMRQSLYKGSSSGCGHSRIPRKGVDLHGRYFGHLAIIGRSNERSKSGSIKWRCMCDCGTIVHETAGNLLSGHTVSCGCYMRKNNSDKLKKRRFIHGLSNTKAYNRSIENKRRELKKNLDLYWNYSMEIELESLQPKCVLCGSADRLSTDHVRPLSKGYGLYPGNAVRLCMKCNSRKNALDLEELNENTRVILLERAEEFRVHWKNYES